MSISNGPPVILVVEDEGLVRMAAADDLMEAGFKVLEAANADQAIQMLETHPEISILFTDIDMPGSMDGIRLAHAVRERWPPVKLVLVSGHQSPTSDILPTDSAFFAKPYDMGSVSKALWAMTT
ncbi:response regulator [Kaistia defluvii]|uniref:response regulator n=1 Tax=Kaistia defluvii TaxID=410841 RepID=UPI00225A6BBF|nr:response regulator [Kaistia defluvii]MCX5517353.1 response regulator [Kaistia defluvii]